MPLVRESKLAVVAMLVVAGCHGVASTPSLEPPLTHPTGTDRQRVSGFTGRPFGVRVSSRDLVYVTEQDANAVARFDLRSLAFAGSIGVGADPGDVVFNRAGSVAFASGYNDGTVHAIAVDRPQHGQRLAISRNAYRLALSNDETSLFVTSTDGSLYAAGLGGMRAAPTVRSVRLGGALNGLAYSSSRDTLYVSATGGRVWKLSAATLQTGGTADLPGGSLQELAISPDQSELYVASEAGWVDVLDAGTLRAKERIELAGLEPFGLAVTPDGAQLYVTSAGTGELAIIDRARRAVVNKIFLGGVPRRVAFDRSGRTAVIANERNWVDVVR